LQGIKRGIMELADLVIVNKADGDLAAAAARTRGDYASAVHLLRPKWNAWATEVLACSALNGIGVAEVWQAVTTFREAVTSNGELAEARSAQATAWLWSEIGDTLIERFRSDTKVATLLPGIEKSVAAGQITPAKAALQLLEAFGSNG
jgi:LAO/AO transport system kinase